MATSLQKHFTHLLKPSRLNGGDESPTTSRHFHISLVWLDVRRVCLGTLAGHYGQWPAQTSHCVNRMLPSFLPKKKQKKTHYPSGPAVSSSHKSPKKKCRETKKVLNRQNFISPISLTFFCSQHLASLLGFYCCSQIVHASAEQTMTLIIDDTSIKTIPSDGIWMG